MKINMFEKDMRGDYVAWDMETTDKTRTASKKRHI